MKYLYLIIITLLLSCGDDDMGQNQSTVFSQISIQSQSDFENLNFDNIDSIKGPLTIRNTSIVDLNFLSGTCVTGIIDIFGNDSLLTLNGIEGLNCVSSLVISQNSNLRNVQALDQLDITDNLIIRNNGLEEIEPLSKLNSITGQILIRESNLADYRLFENLNEVNSLVLGGSMAENLDDLENLNTITSELLINGNQNLIDFCGIKNALENSGQINFEALGNQTNPTIKEIIEDCN